MTALRGGAKAKKHTPSRKATSSSKASKSSKGRKSNRNNDDDDDDEDDEDDYEEDRISFMGKSKSKARAGKQKMQLIPWGNGGGKGGEKKKGLFNFKDKLESLTKVGQSLTKDSYRRLKVTYYHSLLFKYIYVYVDNNMDS